MLASATVASAAIRTLDKRYTAALLGIAVFLALYTGFRLPNAWSATLQSVSLTDGFHRRFIVGTLLRPLALVTGFNYWVFAAFSYLVLASLLAVLVVSALRADRIEKPLLIIGWLLLPTGGFLFNEVGYFEQVLYLVLFASIWLAQRGKLAIATALMCVAPCTHEIAILTVIPLFGLVLLRTVPARQAVIATAIPALLDIIVLAIPAASAGAIDSFAQTLSHANFAYRPDALVLFRRSQSEAWALYPVHEIVASVRAVAYMLIALLVALWFSDRASWRTHRDLLPAWLLLVTSCAAIAVPSLLAYGGWDDNRWLFLVITNFVIVVWFALGHREGVPLRAASITTLVVAALLISRVNLWYFDHLAPRQVGVWPIVKFFKHAADGSLFEMAKE